MRSVAQPSTRGAGLLTPILKLLDELPASPSSGGLHDTFNVVQDLLGLLGWDVHSPLSATRSMEGANGPMIITFWMRGEARLKVAVWPHRAFEGHGVSKFLDFQGSEWRAATDGELWQIVAPAAAASSQSYAFDIRRSDAGALFMRLLSRDSHVGRMVDHEPSEALAVAVGDNTGGPGSTLVWPSRATHCMKRKGCVAYIEYDPASGQAILLPGSLLRARTGSSFPSHLRIIRERALSSLLLVPEGVHLRLAGDLPLSGPSAAAAQVAGTGVNGWLLWFDRQGQPIKRDG
jgi:hypothetical protein